MDKQLLEKLHSACERGDENTAKNVLELGLPVDAVDDYETTALQVAAANGHEMVTRLLLMNGAALDKQNAYGWTALMQAARYGQVKIVSLMLQNHADLHVQNKLNSSALTVAARGGHMQTVRFLVESGIDLNSSGTWCEYTPLMAAAQHGHDTVVRFLLDRGCDVNYRTPSAGLNALMLAALNGHMTTAQVLIQSGADANLTNANDWTALDIASARNNRAVIGYLESKTSRPRKTEPEEQKPDIIEAAKNGDYERMKEILDTDITQRDACSPDDGATPLMFAAMTGKLDMIQLLIDKCCDINKQDTISGWTALMQATYHGRKIVARHLVNANADLTIQAKNRCTAFDLAYLIDDVDTELLRLLAAKTMPVKQKEKTKRDWTMKQNGSSSTISSEINEEHPKSGLKAWWSRMSNRFRYLKLGKTFTMHANRLGPSTEEKFNTDVPVLKSAAAPKSTRTSIDQLHIGADNIDSSQRSFLKNTTETTTLFTLNMNSTQSQMMTETLRPVIPPFHPLPSFDLTDSSRKMPGASRKGLPLLEGGTMVSQTKTPVRTLKFIGATNTSPSNSNTYSYNNSSPGSSGGASSLPGRPVPSNVHSEPYKKMNHIPHPPSTYSEPSYLSQIRPINANQVRLSRLARAGLTTSTNGSSGSSSATPKLYSRTRSTSSKGSTTSTLTPSPSPTPKGVEGSWSSQVVVEDELGGILKKLSLEKYQPIFEEQEVDMEAFLTLTDNDLKELGIAKREPRTQILSAINELSCGKGRERQFLYDTMTNFQNTLSSRTSGSNRYSTGSDLTQWDIQEEDISPESSR